MRNLFGAPYPLTSEIAVGRIQRHRVVVDNNTVYTAECPTAASFALPPGKGPAEKNRLAPQCAQDSFSRSCPRHAARQSERRYEFAVILTGVFAHGTNLDGQSCRICFRCAYANGPGFFKYLSTTASAVRMVSVSKVNVGRAVGA